MESTNNEGRLYIARAPKCRHLFPSPVPAASPCLCSAFSEGLQELPFSKLRSESSDRRDWTYREVLSPRAPS